ncbi:MAG TPA: hypothetical protein VN289_23165 [Paraburkholderia sp.]|nr:hypothetical protein [Paraburkholderia sp.]
MHLDAQLLVGLLAASIGLGFLLGLALVPLLARAIRGVEYL